MIHQANIHKYNSYNIIEMYINRLSLTMQVLFSDRFLDPDVREVASF